jgi:trehalose-6-phosphate synthase
VAQESVVVSRRLIQVVVSKEMGVRRVLGPGAFVVDADDVVATSEALRSAVHLDPGERQERHLAMRDRVLERTPEDWLADRLSACARVDAHGPPSP